MLTVNSGHTNVHDEEMSSRPGVQGDGLVECVNAKVQEYDDFMISVLAIEFLI